MKRFCLALLLCLTMMLPLSAARNDDDDTLYGFTAAGSRVERDLEAKFRAIPDPKIMRDNMQLVLSPPKGPGGGSQPMPDGSRPEPGGWNRIIVQSHPLESDIEVMKEAGAKFRSDVVSGPGGRQILLEDPSGNLVELFEPAPESVK